MVMDKFNNCKNELLIRFMLGTMIFLSEIAIIFITHPLNFIDFIVIFFTLFTLNLAFIIFGIRQKQTRQKMLEARKNTEDSRNRILTIINSLTDAVLSIDSRGKIELYNSAALEILGENGEILNKNLSKICKLAKINTQKFEIQEILKAGKPYFSTNDLILQKEDETLRIEIEIITKQKTLDEERDEFISVVSHELRTPVAILEGSLSNLKLLIDKKAPFKMLEKSAKTAYTQNNFLATMVNDLSILSRTERGIGEGAEEINPKELAETLFKKYHKTAFERGLSLNLNIDNNLNHVKASKLYLEELLQNFITNALKYTREGSIEICFKNSQKGVIFEVKDTGIGISSSDQKRIFEKFYRSE